MIKISKDILENRNLAFRISNEQDFLILKKIITDNNLDESDIVLDIVENQPL